MKSMLRYLIGLALGMVLTTLVLPGWLGVKYPKASRPALDTYVRTDTIYALVTIEPSVVLLGNSTMGYGVDPEKLEILTSKKIHEITLFGSSSAWWYLVIKNNITESTFKPRTLILFFTDTLLTNPANHVTGLYLPFVDEYASPYDDLLLELAFRNQQNFFEKILNSRLPLYGEREKISNLIKNAIEYPFTSLFYDCSSICMQGVAEDVFDYENLLPEKYKKIADDLSANSYTWHQLNFHARLPQSFLPEIIRMCRDNGIQLIIVRMGTLRFLSQADEPLWVRGYFKSLEYYLEENGVSYLDFAHDERLKPVYYFDYNHMSAEGKQVFTEILAEALKPLLK